MYRAAGEMMASDGLLQGVADEGGFWPAFTTNEAALDALMRAIERAGFTPGQEIAISLDIASSEFRTDGQYRLALDGRALDSDGMAEMLIGWLDRYPVVSIEDPLAEDDPEGLRRFTQAVGDRVQIVGDDFLVTNAARVRAAAAAGQCNALLVKPNQAGTLTEAKAALEAARAAGWGAIVSARSGETEDVTIVHLAVGWGATSSRSAPSPAPNAWQSGTKPCASRKRSARRPDLPAAARSRRTTHDNAAIPCDADPGTSPLPCKSPRSPSFVAGLGPAIDAMPRAAGERWRKLRLAQLFVDLVRDPLDLDAQKRQGASGPLVLFLWRLASVAARPRAFLHRRRCHHRRRCPTALQAGQFVTIELVGRRVAGAGLHLTHMMMRHRGGVAHRAMLLMHRHRRGSILDARPAARLRAGHRGGGR